MKPIILAAGYATRMYPLTEKKAKPLLDVNGKPIIDYIVEKLRESGFEEITVLTNEKFYQDFKKWGRAEIILNDGSSSPENKLGAIKDIQHVIEHEAVDEDMLIIAGDGIYNFDFNELLKYTENKKVVCVGLKVPIEEASKYGNMILEGEKVVDFEEKPKNPKSNISSVPIYYFKKEILPLFKKYLNEGNNPDAPGYFIEWLCKREEVHAWIAPEDFHDIGSLEGLEKARRVYESDN